MFFQLFRQSQTQTPTMSEKDLVKSLVVHMRDNYRENAGVFLLKCFDFSFRIKGEIYGVEEYGTL